MAIIIDRTITIKDDKATLDRPLYLYIGDGDITCLFTIEEKKKAATFGSINKTNSITENASYGEVRIYKPDKGSDATSRLIFTDRAEILDDKLQVIFSYKNIDDFSEAGVHKLQIHLYDDDDSERNRFTIPPVDINVLLPVGYDNNATDEAIVGYSLLDARGEEVPTFDEEGNYNKTEWQTGDIITKNKLNKIEDALYEISTIDDNYVTNEALDTALASKANSGHKHSTNDISGLSRVATTGSYNDLSNKPTIPNMNNYATKTELESKAPNNHNHDGSYAAKAHTHDYAPTSHTHSNYASTSDLSNYATKDYVNNSGFITGIPSEYITESELNTKLETKGYATEDYVTRAISNAQINGGGSGDKPDLSGYATTAQLATKADKDHVHNQYLINVPSTYATKTYVDDAIQSAQLSGGNSGPTDLSNYVTENELNDALINKADSSHTHSEYAVTGHNHDGYATREYVDDAILEAQLDGDADLSGYAKIEDIPIIPTNISTFINDENYIASSGIEKITKIEVVNSLPAYEDPNVLYIVKKQ